MTTRIFVDGTDSQSHGHSRCLPSKMVHKRKAVRREICHGKFHTMLGIETQARVDNAVRHPGPRLLHDIVAKLVQIVQVT